MASNRCLQVLKSVQEANNLTDQDVKDVIDYLENLRKDPAFRDKLQAKLEQLTHDAQITRSREKLQVNAIAGLKDDVESFADSYKGGKPDYAEIGNGILTESNKSFDNARQGVFGRMRTTREAVFSEYFAKVAQVVGKQVGRIGKDEGFSKLLAHELAGHDSGNAQAKEIAGILRAGYDKMLARVNKAGADIQKLPNYIFAQHHDQYAVGHAGFDTWYQDIQPRLDPKTWGGEDPKEFLHTVFQNIIMGSHDNAWKAEDFRNASGLGKRLSRPRQLFFKNDGPQDVDGFLAYNKKYGGNNTTLINAMHQIAHGNAQAALMEKFGPNPEATYTKLTDHLASLSRSTDNEVTPGDKQSWKNQFAVVTGKNNQMSNATIAHNFAVFRSIINWAHLGMSTISSFGDINNQAMILHYLGMPVIESYGHAIGTFARFMTDAATSTATLGQGGTRIGALRDPDAMGKLWSLASGMDGMVHANAGRWGADADLSGLTARMTANFFTLNGQAYWDDTVKFGTAKAIATFFAHNADKSWDELSEPMREGMRRGGLLRNEWDQMRGSEKVIVGGHDHILPDKIGNSETALKYQQFLLQNSEVSVPLPGGREMARTVMMEGHRGDPFHEIMRTGLMFKSFPLSIMSKLWPRAIEMGYPGLAMAVIGSLPFGYASLALKNALVGKEPPDFTDPSTTLASFLQGGAGSLAADLVTHKFDQSHSLADLLAGPAAAELSDVASAFSAPLHGEKVSTAMTSALSRDVPFANLWMLKGAYNYLVVSQLLEYQNPGYLDRTQRKAEQEYNEKYFLPPKPLY